MYKDKLDNILGTKIILSRFKVSDDKLIGAKSCIDSDMDYFISPNKLRKRIVNNVREILLAEYLESCLIEESDLPDSRFYDLWVEHTKRNFGYGDILNYSDFEEVFISYGKKAKRFRK